MEEPIINPENKHILKKHLPVMANEIPIKISELSEVEKEVARELYKEKKLRFSSNKLFANKQEPFSIRSAGDTYNIIDIVKNKIIGHISSDLLIFETYVGAVYLHNGERFIVESINHEERKVFVFKSNGSYITEPLKESFIDIIEIKESKKVKTLELFKGIVKVKTSVIGYSTRDFENDEILQDYIFENEQILTREFETEGFWFTMPNQWEDEILVRNLKHNVRNLIQFLRKKEQLYTGGFVYSDIAYENLKKFLKTGDTDAFNFALKATESFINKLSEKEKEEYKEIVKRIKERKNGFLGALHGVEHALIGIYPLFAMNDRWDIGGLSTPFYPETGKPTIFIYDGYEGGVGYSEVGFNKLESMIESTYKTIAKCQCISGCPSCIYSPKCGNSNDYLDKTSSILLSHKLLKELK
jgi:DEAD/DEAH box helicase domain-containing protein